MAGKSEEIRREQEIAAEARPFILEQLRAKREPLEIGQAVSERWGVDGRLSYRWAQYITEDFFGQKKKYVAIGLVMIWIGALVAAAGVVLTLFSILASIPLWIIGLAVGLPLIIAGSVVVARSPYMVTLSV